MLQSVMVFPNNDFFNVTPLLDDNVAKLINTDQIESYMTSASTSPIQDYLLAPSNMASFHPQQHPNHHRHNTNTQTFPVSMPSMVSQSAPSSPSYPVKNEESMDYLLYPSFDLAASSPQQHQASPQPQVLPSQSPQQRMIPFTDVSLLQQRQHHQQQQQQHAQQLRLQHQQRALEQQQYQMSTVTSAIISSIAANTNLMAPSFNNNNNNSSIPTAAPFDATPAFNFRPNNGATYAAHPAAPKRKHEEPIEESMVPVTPSPSSSSSSTVVAPLSPSISSPSLSVSTPTSRISTSSRLDKIKPARSTRVTKSTPSSSSSSPSTSMISSAATTSTSSSSSIKSLTKKTAKKTTKDSEDVDSSASMDASTAAPHTGNITHPRRAAQNRAAQRTFRNRRKAYIKELEQKVQEMDRTRELMETIHHENQEVWRRVQILEALASQSGLQLPIFPAMTPFSGMEASVGSPYGGHMMMGGHHHSHSHGHSRQHGSSSSSNEDEEDDDEMREFSSSQASYMDPRFHQHQSMDMHRQL
ncbi:hypothetical protein BGZ93_000884 [Podila epicladia]|nr:hypothetical protein BGZ92_011634 [Podila epicladia]KAG0085028.1 hypothetical protein BGZ93_000884 [Podila epicladia]